MIGERAAVTPRRSDLKSFVKFWDDLAIKYLEEYEPLQSESQGLCVRSPDKKINSITSRLKRSSGILKEMQSRAANELSLLLCPERICQNTFTDLEPILIRVSEFVGVMDRDDFGDDIEWIGEEEEFEEIMALGHTIIAHQEPEDLYYDMSCILLARIDALKSARQELSQTRAYLENMKKRRIFGDMPGLPSTSRLAALLKKDFTASPLKKHGFGKLPLELRLTILELASSDKHKETMSSRKFPLSAVSFETRSFVHSKFARVIRLLAPESSRGSTMSYFNFKADTVVVDLSRLPGAAYSDILYMQRECFRSLFTFSRAKKLLVKMPAFDIEPEDGQLDCYFPVLPIFRLCCPELSVLSVEMSEYTYASGDSPPVDLDSNALDHLWFVWSQRPRDFKRASKPYLHYLEALPSHLTEKLSHVNTSHGPAWMPKIRIQLNIDLAPDKSLGNCILSSRYDYMWRLFEEPENSLDLDCDNRKPQSDWEISYNARMSSLHDQRFTSLCKVLAQCGS